MAIVCLDTDILIDAIRAEEPLSRLASISGSGACATIITILELYYGAFKSKNAGDVALVDLLKNDITIIDLNEEDARLAGKMMAELDKKGSRLDFRDVAIGAICINRRMTLITRNTKHFGRLSAYGLLVANI